jgi:hypothetical protein
MTKAKAKSSGKGTSVKAPFPFLGQGDAGYYEWFEMWVWFEAPVPNAKRAALAAGGPPPCLRDLEWPQPELMWPSTGDQWIHQHLIEAYGTPKAKARFAKAEARRESGDDDHDVLDDLLAGHEQKIFNDDIERWLVEMHAKHPILFAVRREDHEAGGTKLGAWHTASVVSFIERVSPALEALAKKNLGKNDKRRHAITLALNFVGPEKFTPSIRRLANEKELVKTTSPDTKAEEDALHKLSREFRGKKFADTEKLLTHVTSPNGWLRALITLTDDIYCMGADIEPPPAHRLVLSTIGALGNRKLSVVRALPYAKEKLSIHLVCVAYAGLLQAAAWANDRRTFDTVAELLDEMPEALRFYLVSTAEKLDAKRPDFAKRVRALMPAPTAKELWVLAARTSDRKRRLELYEQAAVAPKPPWEVISNGIATLLALHPKQLPADAAERWLARGRALKRGEVQHKVACLLVRLGRHEEGAKHAILALEQGADRDDVRKDSELTPIKKHPAFVAALKAKS